jgi:hypothetical protein
MCRDLRPNPGPRAENGARGACCCRISVAFCRISVAFFRISVAFCRISVAFFRISVAFFRIFVSSFAGHYRIYHMPLRAFSREPTVAFFAFSRRPCLAFRGMAAEKFPHPKRFKPFHSDTVFVHKRAHFVQKPPLLNQ